MARTKGPWTTTRCTCGHDGCKKYFVSVCAGNDGRMDKEDADLVSAAPELYEALSGMMLAMKTDDVNAMAKYMAIGIDALAKAEGQT